MKKQLFVSVWIIILSLSSCQQSEEPIPEPVFPEYNINEESSIGIDPYNDDLSETDAGIVAKIYQKQSMKSRLTTGSGVKNVVVLRDENGNPVIYAVNFNDGYILISASKSTYPILAEVDHGEFSLDAPPSGIDVMINEYKDAIAFNKKYVDPRDIKPFWIAYERKDQIISESGSRAIDPDLTDARSNLVYELRNQGYQVYTSIDALYELPDQISQSVFNYIDGIRSEFMEETGQDSYNAWVLAVLPSGNTRIIEPMTTTKWRQKAPYNSGLSNTDMALGCVTVAVAQLMKYYKYPYNINWDLMPDDLIDGQVAPYLTEFLAKLRTELKVNNSGGSNISNAINTLRDYGYQASESNTIFSIPCFTRGEDKKTGIGHAWIIDGERYTVNETEYSIYFPSHTKWPDFVYLPHEAQTNIMPSPESYVYHMNWGGYGQYNGWFRSYDIAFTKVEIDGSTVIRDYSEDRKYIKITGHN